MSTLLFDLACRIFSTRFIKLHLPGHIANSTLKIFNATSEFSFTLQWSLIKTICGRCWQAKHDPEARDSVCYSFAPARISPSDFALLYEMMEGSLYISLNSGWSWIKCHLLIKMFLRFGKAGWYVVTKGRIFFRTSLFFCKANFRSVNLTLRGDFCYVIVRVTSSAKALKL